MASSETGTTVVLRYETMNEEYFEEFDAQPISRIKPDFLSDPEEGFYIHLRLTMSLLMT